MPHGFKSGSDIDRVAFATQAVERDELFRSPDSGGVVGIVVNPGVLYSVADYRLGVVTWRDGETLDYDDSDAIVLICSHGAGVPPPPAGIPVFATFIGYKVDPDDSTIIYAVYVAVHGAVGGAGMSLVNVTSATADSDGAWPATLYINNGDGTWGTGPVIRMQVTPSAGTTFAVGDYWAEKNGTKIGDGTTRTVTDGVLNSTTTITSASASFVVGDIGAKVTGTGIPVNTVIASRTNSTTVVLSHAATATATGVHITIVTQVTYDLYFDVGAIQYEQVGCSGGVPGTYLITTAWPWTIGSFVPD